ncbi:Protein kinase C, brain isozyme [Gryllus bimaculatus]|nr:Protein kinase C, brain isozyme [Gryllus bimaculatus]
MCDVSLENFQRIVEGIGTENIVIKNVLDPSEETKKAPEIQDFDLIKPISRGAFGKVFLGCKKNNPELVYAIKVMSKNEMVNKNMASQIVSERNALALARSPFCVQLFYSLQTVSHVFLVMEYMVGGDLKTLLSMYGFFDEPMAVFYAAEVTLALEYLHKHGIVHRDIKPDNMLISKCGHIKLTDFGLSRVPVHRDLEISDFVNNTPNVGVANEFSRTPGQLLSLTSHLSFGSSQKGFTIYSDEPHSTPRSTVNSAFNTCVLQDQTNLSCISGKSFGSSKISERTAFFRSQTLHYISNSSVSSNASNDTGLSGILPFLSTTEPNSGHLNSAFDQEEKSESSSSFHSCNTSIHSDQHDLASAKENMCESGVGGLDFSSPLSRSNFKRPLSRGFKRKRSLQLELSEHTNLTQEFVGIALSNDTPQGCKTPESVEDLKRSPLKSVLKSRMNYDIDEYRCYGTRDEIAFSTPVSSTSKNKKAKITRFDLPSGDILHHEKILLSPPEVINVSPIPSASQTPFRTPKSVRRGKISSDQRILGTPDYLAPELLLQHGHGFAVDWWALGVCLYEFMTGIPPFNDQTPQAVFNNILKRDIEWPVGEEELSEAAQNAIDNLLTLDPNLRPSANGVRAMPLFSNVNWDDMDSMNVPFIPQPDDYADTYYFEARNKLLQLNVSNVSNP